MTADDETATQTGITPEGAGNTAAPIDRGTAWTPAPAESPGAVPAGAAGSNRTRWIVAGLGLVLIAGLTIGAGFLLAGRGTPEALSYIPASVPVVAELRMDLPGDQLQKVGNLMAHFPGFKDQSTLSQKLAESLSKLTTQVSKGSVDYATQVAPWIAGPLFAGLDLDPTKASQPETGVLVATTDGKADCATLFTGDTKTTTVGSLTMLTNSDGTAGCVLDGRFALIGTPATIQAALDAHARHAGMDQDPTYKRARDALGGDRLATYYVSGNLYDEISQAMGAMMGTGLAANPFGGFGGLGSGASVPSWVIGGVRAEDDALVFDAVAGPSRAIAASGAPAGSSPAGSPLPSLLSAPPDHAGRIAGLVPGDALAMADVHGAGVGLENLITIVRSQPGLGESLAQVDTALAAVGGAHQLIGWVDDAGIVVLPDGQGVAGGVVLLAADEATATSHIQQLLGFVKLAALSANLQVHDETIAGTTVTFIEGNAGSLVPGFGGLSTDGANFSIAVASHGAAVYIGSGATFAHKMLELASGSSLADQAAYQALLKRTSDSGAGEVYVAASRIAALADGLLPADQKASFDTDVKPYVDPLDSAFLSWWHQGDLTRQRLLVTVK